MDKTVIGGYQIGELLGTGATAVVHKGTRLSDGFQVALKVLHPDLIDNPDLLKRFRREARTLQKVTHENIVKFIDFIEEPPRFVFVMELLNGGTLESFFEAKGKVRPDRCITWTWQLAEALAAAHQHNVIHRDIKPANIFLTVKGRVVLSDFGLARPDNEKLTMAGTKMVGTPLYMAPEQVLGRASTPATDVYQVGLMLYEMVTGTRAFQRDDAYTQMMVRLDEDLTLPPEVQVSPAIRQIIAHCGFRNPMRRYPTGFELARDLQAANQDLPLPWSPPRPGSFVGKAAEEGGLDWRNTRNYSSTMLVCPQINLEYEPAGKAFVVGSDHAAQVVLENHANSIAPRQLRITPREGVWEIETGNFQAQVRIQGEVLNAGTRELKNGDILELGGFELLWVDPPPLPEEENSEAGSIGNQNRADGANLTSQSESGGGCLASVLLFAFSFGVGMFALGKELL